MTSEKKWDNFRASEKKEEKSRVTLIVQCIVCILFFLKNLKHSMAYTKELMIKLATLHKNTMGKANFFI